MIDNFLNTVKGELAEQLTGSADIDSANLNGVADVVADTFKDSIGEKLSGGGLGDIMGLLGGGGSSSPLAGNLVGSVVSNLVSKLGLSEGVAGTIANVAVPFIIEKFGSFTKGEGADSEAGLSNLLGGLASGSLKDNLLGGLGDKLGF